MGNSSSYEQQYGQGQKQQYASTTNTTICSTTKQQYGQQPIQQYGHNNNNTDNNN